MDNAQSGTREVGGSPRPWLFIERTTRACYMPCCVVHIVTTLGCACEALLEAILMVLITSCFVIAPLMCGDVEDCVSIAVSFIYCAASREHYPFLACVIRVQQISAL